MIRTVGPFQKLENNKFGKKVFLEKNDKDELWSLTYRHKKLKKPFIIKINASHYNKLMAMHTRSTNDDVSLHAFHFILFCTLLRYSSLSGGQLLQDLRGGGMQVRKSSKRFWP